MNDLNRRRFLQSASLIVAGGYSQFAFGNSTVEPPKFADVPTFNPKALFLTWQRDPTTTMTVQWIGSEAEGAERPVWYAKKGSGQWRNQEYSTRPFPITDQWVHRAELTSLEPGTDYIFRVGTDSAEQRFRTAPAKDTNAIQFVSGGDCGVGPHPRHTNKLAAAQSPLFALLGGDLAYENGKDPDRFLEFLENYSNDLRDDEQRLIPMIACLGNHDVDGSYGQPLKRARFFNSVFDGLFPETGYAALDFGQYLSVVLLDTNHTSPVAARRPIGWHERSRNVRIARTCSWPITCRPTHRTESLKGRLALAEPAQITGDIGCRCSNGTTSMPSWSTTITPTRERIRCWMGDRTRRAFYILATGPGDGFANRRIWINVRTSRSLRKVITYPCIASKASSDSIWRFRIPAALSTSARRPNAAERAAAD